MKEDIRELLKEALSKKTCIEYAVAAVIETREREYILGWNGPPQGITHTKCFMKKEPNLHDLYLCPAVHAERRAISRAAKDGLATRGATMYLSGWFPCADCAKSIIEAGIETLVIPDGIYQDKDHHILMPSLANTPYNFEMSEWHLRKTGVKIIVDASIKVNK
jgi:dCMP deaminase